MTKREKGVETAPCPNCGDDMPLEEQPDGSFAAKSHEACFPAGDKSEKQEKASSGSSREKGTSTSKGDS